MAATPRNRSVVAGDAIWVEGLKEVQTGLRNVSKSLAKETRGSFKRIADHVVGVAQQRMPWQDGTAARSLRPLGSNAGAAIRFPAGGPGSGGDAAGYYPWLDFGGGQPTGRGVRRSEQRGLSFRRPFIKEGRYLYPAIRESHDWMIDELGDAIEDVFHREQFEVVG